MKKLLLILFSLLLVNSFAFGQMSGNLGSGNSSSHGNTVTLSIHCNVQGAAIHISGGDIIGTKVGYADFSIELSPGATSLFCRSAYRRRRWLEYGMPLHEQRSHVSGEDLSHRCSAGSSQQLDGPGDRYRRSGGRIPYPFP